MSKPDVDPLRRLGQQVAREQDQQLASHPSLRQARTRLLAGDAPRARWVPSSRQVFALSALLTTLVLVLPGLLARRGSDVTFRAAGEPGAVDAWIAAPTAAALPVRFSDGSAFDLAPGARARVASVAPEGARVVLERGRAEVAVVHRPDTRWTLSAGPFEVRVTGTRFAVEWDAAHEVFRLAMAEGSVVVTGACLTGPTTFRGGDALSLACPARPASSAPDQALAPARPSLGAALAPAGSSELSPGASPAGSTGASVAPGGSSEGPTGASDPVSGLLNVAPGQAAPGSPAGGPTGREAVSGPAPAVAVAPRGPDAPGAPGAPAGSAREAVDWREIALARRHREALAAAEAAGFEGLCAGASAGDLVLLADASRFAGATGRARQALVALRGRFAGDARAATAAFSLGRMAFDQQGAFGEAASWFATYLAEQPGGSLAPEALGRLFEARQRAGDATGAHQAAQQYLVRYPAGPYANLARQLVP